MSSIQVGATLKQSLDGLTQNGTNLWDGTVVVSGAVTQYTVPFYVKNKDTIGIQVSVPSTGSPNGSFALQGSNDFSAQEGNVQPDGNLKNWSTISFWDESTGGWVQSKAVVGAQSFMASVQVLSPAWLRLVWTNTSGSAQPTIRSQIKADGGR